MALTDRIILARAPEFGLGRLIVLPAVRQLRRDDGETEILQHRVMQVLVALASAKGEIVTRDELTESCWDGRVVGEDAINRVLSRLRATAAGIGEGSFRIETVTRVGYRLIAAEAVRRQDQADEPREPAPAIAPERPDRRTLLAGGAAAIAALGAGAWWWTQRNAPHEAAPVVAALMDQASTALRQDSREGQNQAIALYQRVVAIEPDYADGWAALGYAYAATANYREHGESDALRVRARAAGERALALKPGHAFGRAAIAMALPTRGNWLRIERALRDAVAAHDGNDQIPLALVRVLMAVGRNADALPLVERIGASRTPTPDRLFLHISLLWSLDRLEEADRAMSEATSLYPTHFAIWFIRYYILMYSGRMSAAIALASDRAQRPSGIPSAEFESIIDVAHALQSRNPADVARVIAAQQARAREGAGYAENAIQFACALGRVDEAFAIAEAYYFGRGFTVPEIRFTVEQGVYTPLRDRMTYFLFNPATRPMRADPRFAPLVAELGLTAYWAAAGARPDFQRA
jgi:DNA-binding winged helix-turn-helix (wHTH) protein